MTKVEMLKEELRPLISDLIAGKDISEIENYLKMNSNLPGQRGNLELAYALSGLLDNYKLEEHKKLFPIFKKWTELSITEAPVNSSEEFLPFCGVHSIGKLGSLNQKFFPESLVLLKALSHSERWRTREGVTMGLQFLLDKYPQTMVDEFNKWIEEENLLELRALITAYAEPKLLVKKIISQNALKSHRKIFEIVLRQKERKTEEFRVLRKALGYTFSLVAVIYTPNSFGVMKKLIQLNNKDINWILKENIKKNRIIKHAPERVKEILELLEKRK